MISPTPEGKLNICNFIQVLVSAETKLTIEDRWCAGVGRRGMMRAVELKDSRGARAGWRP
jgi:hypothetical protein